MLGRGIEKAGVAPFGEAVEVLRAADLAFVNLECPLTERPYARKKVVNVRAKPERVRWLVEAGIDGVSVANNHAADCGAEGLRDTVELLKSKGLFAAGLKGAPVVRTVRGTTIGFLALTDFPHDAVESQGVVDPASLEREVRALADRVDHVVVSVHWGVEGRPLPSPRQRELAGRAERGGASVVVGHGPHVLQPIEAGAAVVAFSLGDLVFDRRGERAVLVVELRGRDVRRRLIRFDQTEGAALWPSTPGRG